jgi:hypothetical protein
MSTTVPSSTAPPVTVSEVMHHGVMRGIAAVVLAALVVVLPGCGGGRSSQSSHQSPQPRAATAPATTASAQAPSTGAPSANAGASRSASASAGAVTATLRAGTHRPRVQRAWPVRFTVTSAGRPVAASVEYEYLFAGQVVAHRSHYRFTGRFSDVFRWPASAVGYPLTFRAVIRAQGATINLDYPVQVAR